MQHADLIVMADQVVTCSGPPGPRRKKDCEKFEVIQDGAVAIVGGSIREVGPRAELLERWSGDWFRQPQTCLLPGLVDPHCHPLWGGDRKHEFELRARGAGYEEIHAAGGGIAHTVAATVESSDEELLARSKAAIERMMAHGTTTIEAKSGYGLEVEEELRQLRLIGQLAQELPVDIVPTCLGAHALPPEFENDRDGFLRQITDVLLPRVAEEKLARYADVFCERGAFTCVESKRVLEAAKALGLGLRIHAEEFSNLGGSRMAALLGAASCDHLQHLSDEDLGVLLESEIVPTVIPGTSFFLDLDVYAPARKMWDAGLPVALGTDYNAGSCLMESMQMAMSLAVLKMKMTPQEALIAATVNAAHSLGLSQRLGSLEPGKQADMIVLEGADWRDFVYRFGSNSVRAVIKKGAILNTVLTSPMGAPI